MKVLFLLLIILTSALPALPQSVTSHLEGRITVNPEIDPTDDYSGIEIIVAMRTPAGIDTLGHDVTNQTGNFDFTITAPDVGVYPLIIIRRGRILVSGEIAVSDGDSATLSAQLPVDGRFLRIRSEENAAWMAYKNALTQHNQGIVEMLQDGESSEGEATLQSNIGSTGSVLWSIFTNYPETFGGRMAFAESITILEGWNDSLVVERARMIQPDGVRFVDVVRAARRAQARLEGQEAALALIDELETRASIPEVLAGIQSERVQAFIDSAQTDQALAAAQQLEDRFPDSPWADWARRTEYEIANLFPGSPAPAFSTVTADEDPFSLEQLRGNYVILEFWMPMSEVFQRQIPQRAALLEEFSDHPVSFVSISLERDREANEAFKEGRQFEGIHIYEGQGAEGEIAQLYNIVSIPTRVLIGPDLTIIGKYIGEAMLALAESLAILLSEDDRPN